MIIGLVDEANFHFSDFLNLLLEIFLFCYIYLASAIALIVLASCGLSSPSSPLVVTFNI